MNKRSSAQSIPIGLGSRIKAARQALGWSQSELGKAVGVSKSAVSQWERGAVQNLKLGNLFTAAHVLNKDIRELVFGEDGKAIPEVREKDSRANDRMSPHRLSLIRAYDQLPRDVRSHIRGLILALAQGGESKH